MSWPETQVAGRTQSRGRSRSRVKVYLPWAPFIVTTARSAVAANGSATADSFDHGARQVPQETGAKLWRRRSKVSPRSRPRRRRRQRGRACHSDVAQVCAHPAAGWWLALKWASKAILANKRTVPPHGASTRQAAKAWRSPLTAGNKKGNVAGIRHVFLARRPGFPNRRFAIRLMKGGGPFV